ncbi:NUDIX domain-containing protein [Agarivorans sp. QJM3NY_33]|uniref:NUDIX domain-containing protein n=1 Tax=Agarivorans sp. QJM3NY_33 TaxID=3421432 RepID=UPI003D7CE146
MKHRIRAGGVILNKNNEILLVRHVDHTGEWWVPPGGGFDDQDYSTIDTVKREVFEETGLTVQVGPLIYVREYSETSTSIHHLEVFYLVTEYFGKETIDNLKGLGGDEFLIKELKWFAQDDFDNVTVWPEELKDELWQDISISNPSVKYLGVHAEPL